MRTTAAAQERIILGIDPGTNVLGYGLLSVCGKKAEMIAMGVIDLRRVSDVYLKLGRIYERIMGVIDAFHPDELAIEAPFFGKNVQSMLKLGRAQGVVIAAAIARQIPIHEYAPMNGGERSEMMMQISTTFFPLILYFVMKYASVVPMRMASTVTQSVTEKLLIIDW